MKDNKPISLSEPNAWVMKYLAPFIFVFFPICWYWINKDYVFPLIFFTIGFIYWLFRFLPLKEVKFIDNYLIISNDFQKDRVHIDEIEKLIMGGWSMHLVQIYFKRPTKFGLMITFAAMQRGMGGGEISKTVKSILEQIQENIGGHKGDIKNDNE